MKKIRVILYQKPLGISLNRRDISDMKAFSPHFVCFPEYFFVSRRLGNHGQTPLNQKRQLQRLELLSRELGTIVIGGSMPELNGRKLHNTTFIYDNGKPAGYYRKKNLFIAEQGKITPGTEYRIFAAYGITYGILICADVFHDESFMFMNEHKAQIIFSPTFSLYKNESVDEKFKRDNDIYVRGSSLAEAPIVKVCGVKSDYKNFLQARSLIASPEGILYRVSPEEEDKSLIIKKTVEIK